LYTSGPAWRSRIDSIQSVAGHPDASPELMPRHQIALALPLFAAAWVLRSSQVAGGALV